LFDFRLLQQYRHETDIAGRPEESVLMREADFT
jgi:hypothetical protein